MAVIEMPKTQYCTSFSCKIPVHYFVLIITDYFYDGPNDVQCQ